jgi:hypothetical protein
LHHTSLEILQIHSQCLKFQDSSDYFVIASEGF